MKFSLKAPKTSRSDPDSRRAYSRWHYRQNKEKYKARARAYSRANRDKLRDYIAAFLNENPCVDCGEADPIVLEFDHRDPATKRFNVGDAVRKSCGLATVIAEIAKCDVRCANCHRRKTFRAFEGNPRVLLGGK